MLLRERRWRWWSIISCFSVGVITNDNTDNTDNTRRTLIASHPQPARYNLQLSPCLSLSRVCQDNKELQFIFDLYFVSTSTTSPFSVYCMLRKLYIIW